MANHIPAIPLRSGIRLFGRFVDVDIRQAPPGPPVELELQLGPPALPQLQPNPNFNLGSGVKRCRIEKEETEVDGKHVIVKRMKQKQPSLVSSELRKLLDKLGVPSDQDPTHFFTRDLYNTDVNKVQNRFAIPRTQILKPFLNDEEEALLQQRDNNGNLKKLEVRVIDPLLVVHNLNLSRWGYEKPKEKSKSKDCSWSYALNHGWMKIVHTNGLAARDKIEVWSFRFSDDSLGFIIFKVGMVASDGGNMDKDNGMTVQYFPGYNERC